MILITCIDNRKGIMFNKRRVSKDTLLIERLKGITKENKIYVSEYSKPLFDGFNNLVLSIENLTNNDFYFLEDEDYNGNIDKIIIYKWNRDYPADKYFDIDLSSYELISTQDFQGSSHDLITEEIYIKEN